VPKPEKPGQVVDPRHGGPDKNISNPGKGPDGRPLNGKAPQNGAGRLIAPGRDRTGALHDVENNIRDVQNRHADRDGHDHWYNWNGRQVNHRWDHGRDWWGFYYGDVFFWTMYLNNYYWWWDPYWHRWCYFNQDQWWWVDPDTGVTYWYTDGGYYRYGDSDGGVVMQPDPTQPVDAPPDQDNTPQPAVYTSADGTRTVTVSADGNQTAYLNDTADPPSFQPVWLGDGVTSVTFKNDDQGNLSQILTVKADGSFDVYDQNGFAITNTAQPQVFTSPDGSRSVSISADGNGTATLSDTANPPSFDPIVLNNGVTDVQFTSDDQGNLTGFTLVLNDGTTAAYDQNGQAAAISAPSVPAPDPNASGTNAPAGPSSFSKSITNSAAFQALKGALNW
jgi:hypothetical protein